MSETLGVFAKSGDEPERLILQSFRCETSSFVVVNFSHLCQ